jgi:nucleoid DNA-binding protein
MATGFKERVLIPALRKQGLSVRGARAAIDAVLGSIKDALGRHECVELAVGSFTVMENPKERGWRFGTIVIFDKYRVAFRPSAELNLAAAAAPPSPPPPKRKRRKKKIVIKSELTISAELIVEFIRKNVQGGNWSLFFKYLSVPVGPSIAAVFKNTKPTPDERRPLSEAAQVIEECTPKEMPDDPWERLDACLEWFARWTQRVMPNAVWQQAMQEAMKTLLPRDPMRTLDGR